MGTEGFRLERDNNVDLAFEGVYLGGDSSFEERYNEQRWTEIRVYRTDTDKYVVEIVGATNVDGEVTRRKAHVEDTPQAVRERLQRTNNEGHVYLTHLALNTLYEAAENDRAFDGVLVETV